MARIALLQMSSGVRPDENAQILSDAVEQAARAGAVMMFSPEMSGLLDRDRKRAVTSIKGEEQDVSLLAVQQACRDHRIWACIGSLAIKSERSDGRTFNRSFVVNDQGTIFARYDKMHMFDVDLPTGETWRESNAFAPGDRSVVVNTPLGMIGLSICYDMRFPALYQRLSEAGATILTVPAAFTVPTGMAHWHTVLRARAIENACWVLAPAQSGLHEDGRSTYGHSLVISPWGEVILDMEDRIGLEVVDIDLDEPMEARRRIPVIAHRRTIKKPDIVS